MDDNRTIYNIYYTTIWDQDICPRIVNLSNFLEDSVPRKMDILIAACGAGTVADYNGNGVFDMDDIQILIEDEINALVAKDPDDFVAIMIDHILQVGIDKFKVQIVRGNRTYDAEFYGPENNYLLKELVIPVAKNELANALYYADRIKLHHKTLSEQIGGLTDKTNTVVEWCDEWDFASETQWKEMEAKLDHIYRTYVRL